MPLVSVTLRARKTGGSALTVVVKQQQECFHKRTSIWSLTQKTSTKAARLLGKV